MSDAQRSPWTEAPRINHWVYEAVPGQIKGYDGQGRVMMAIETDAQFAQRLVEAFGSIFKPRGSATEASVTVR
ncbi:MAG: hypothetical protein EKK53_03730 [Burkholderiales bacterium]|nr:MAG: hypothetical protein EKK53_03730 [Burkholderiales bacterium]